MILRLFRCRAQPGQRKAVARMQVAFGIPVVKGKPGLVAFYPAKPIGTDSDEFAFITIWKDMESMKMWAGKDWEKAVLPEEEKPVLRDLSVHHYEINEPRAGGRN